MKSWLLSTSNTPLLIALYAAALGIQSSLFTPSFLKYLQPDITLTLVLWLAMRRSFTEGGVLTLFISYIAELNSSAPKGVFMLTYMLVFLLTRAASRWVFLPSLNSVVITALVASFFWKSSVVLCFSLFDLAIAQMKHSASTLFPSAAMQGILTLWGFKFLKWFDAITLKDERARQRLQTELQLDEDDY